MFLQNFAVKTNFGLNLSQRWPDMESAVPVETHLNLRVLLKKM